LSWVKVYDSLFIYKNEIIANVAKSHTTTAAALPSIPHVWGFKELAIKADSR